MAQSAKKSACGSTLVAAQRSRGLRAPGGEDFVGDLMPTGRLPVLEESALSAHFCPGKGTGDNEAARRVTCGVHLGHAAPDLVTLTPDQGALVTAMSAAEYGRDGVPQQGVDGIVAEMGVATDNHAVDLLDRAGGLLIGKVL